MTDIRELKRVIASGQESAAKRIKKNETEEEEEINNESKSIFNPSPVEQALQNRVVLQNIFKFLHLDDLQVCRSVDLPHWSSEIEHAMRQRTILHIYLEYWEEGITMVKMVQNKMFQFQFQSISELINKLETCEKGHEIWLTLIYVDFGSEEMKIFLTKFAKFIRSLDLCAGSLDDMSPSDLQELLCGLPNLYDLCLATIPYHWERSEEGNLPYLWNLSTLLPQVRRLSFSSYRPYFCLKLDRELLEGLLQILPNIKSVYGFPFDSIHILKLDDDLILDLINDINVSYSSSANFGEMQIKLSHLASISSKIDLGMADLSLEILPKRLKLEDLIKSFESLSTIFRNNQHTLEYFILEPICHPQLLEYPEMESVKKLCLSCSNRRPDYRNAVKSGKFFGKRFDTLKTFPNLSHVIFRGYQCSLKEFLKFFPKDAFTKKYFEGVASLHLKLAYFEELEELEKLANIFPDVTNLKLSVGINVHRLEEVMALIIRRWPKLISLKIKIDVISLECYGNMEKYSLDPVFTGISAAKCDELRENKKKMSIDWNIYRENAAISTMTELKELTMIFHSRYPRTVKVIPLFSPVTPYYGFQCLPDLKVNFAIPFDDEENDKIQEMLSQMERYVNFNPHYYRFNPYLY